MGYKYFGGRLSPKPITDLLRENGDWAIRFIFLTLAVSPLRAMTRWNGIIGIRRMLGLFALFYTVAHLSFYVIDQRFVVWRIALEIVLRTYLTIGFAAVAILAVMGWTSNDAAVKRLGAQRWQKIHRWIYVAAFLALLHFFMQVRIRAYEPSLLSGLAILLGGYRLLQRRSRDVPMWQVFLLAALAPLATALVEAGYYHFSMNAPLAPVLNANFDFSYEIRPAWFVLAAGGAMVLVKGYGLWRNRKAARQSMRREVVAAR
ncbi:MAG: sulfite oxidase heme-binding subunit YedZ [Beijerinckiaceae bacterium]